MKAAEIPPYLRFDLVTLKYYDLSGCTIAEKFEWAQIILQPFKKALTGSKFEFLVIFSKDKSDSNDSSTLLDHIDKLVQISDRCRVYKFYIESHINGNYSTHILAAILRFDAIIRCSKIRVKFDFGRRMKTRLPIEAIENWLNCTNANGQEHDQRFLTKERYLSVHGIS